jgi:DnaA family protein
MQQLLLDIRPRARPSLDRYIVGRNHELLAHLTAMLDGRAAEHSVYLWGDAGSGKSYLLDAFAAAAAERGMRVGSVGQTDATVVVADQAEAWDEAMQVAAFAAFNAVRERGGMWLAAGRAPPAELPLLADLQSRLGWGLVFRVHNLSDAEKRAALTEHAARLGFALEPHVADYLFNHLARDMGTLMQTLDALDRLSLQTRRPITLPLIRQLID